MEADAKNVLKYMASNGLIANPNKTAMIFLNTKSEEPITIKIGEVTITQDKHAKLLGITFNEKQDWKDQIYGKGGVLSSLNQRFFLIRRLQNVMNKESLLKVADSLYMSKIRYGLQLMGKVRMSKEDLLNEDLDAIQLSQNKLVRLLNGKSLIDMVSTEVLLKNIGMSSVNQMHCQIKLLEIWKAMNVKDYPIKITSTSSCSDSATTRSGGNVRLVENGKSNLCSKTFINDAIKIWNRAPKELEECSTILPPKRPSNNFQKLCQSNLILLI